MLQSPVRIQNTIKVKAMLHTSHLHRWSFPNMLLLIENLNFIHIFDFRWRKANTESDLHCQQRGHGLEKGHGYHLRVHDLVLLLLRGRSRWRPSWILHDQLPAQRAGSRSFPGILAGHKCPGKNDHITIFLSELLNVHFAWRFRIWKELKSSLLQIL